MFFEATLVPFLMKLTYLNMAHKLALFVGRFISLKTIFKNQYVSELYPHDESNITQ